MSQIDPRLPWTDEQLARVNRVIQEEAARARVAATFLPLSGPLPPDTDFVRAQRVQFQPFDGRAGHNLPAIAADDTSTIRLATLQVRVSLRGAQMADPEMRSALQLFRRAANVLARLEDTMVFLGQTAENRGPPLKSDVIGDAEQPAEDPAYAALGCEIKGGEPTIGLLRAAPADNRVKLKDPEELVSEVSRAIGLLERGGHFGPFAAVLGQELFIAAQTPSRGSLVLPQDRIIPLLGGAPFLRSSTLPDFAALVVALGGEPLELVIAKDVSVDFLEVTSEPMYVFRVFEKMVLRVKEPEAIARLETEPGAKEDVQPAVEGPPPAFEPSDVRATVEGPPPGLEPSDAPEEAAEPPPEGPRRSRTRGAQRRSPTSRKGGGATRRHRGAGSTRETTS